MTSSSKIYVAGHRGLVGQAIIRELQRLGYTSLITRTSSELDLRNQADTLEFFKQQKPEYVILAAAKAGGIMENIQSPAEFIYDNLMIQSNVIHSAYLYGVKKLLFLSSDSVYPCNLPSPISESALLSGKLEPTDEGYSIAKIAGIKMCEMYNRQYNTNFICALPCNLYGYGDNFDSAYAHVIPALMQRFYNAKIQHSPYIEIWGTGNARREFMFVDDIADACLFLLKNDLDTDFINVGTGKDISIKELSYMLSSIVGYEGEIRFDTSKPDGKLQKLMDVTKLNQYGWTYHTELEIGLRKLYQWFLDEIVHEKIY